MSLSSAFSRLLVTLFVCFAAMLASAEDKPRVRLGTSLGDIVVELDPVKAPKTSENFLQYVRDGYYAGTIFHRVIDGFMIQGGGYTEKLVRKPTRPPIPLEAGRGLSNLRGSIAMARTGDPNSANAQFFINVVDNVSLDTLGGGYAVFGKVVEGMDVVDKIKALKTSARGSELQNLPDETVVILKASIEPAAKP